MLIARNNRKSYRLTLVLALTLTFIVGAWPRPVHAATFIVTNTNDSGAGSLRQAVLDANAAVGADTIVFDAGVFSTPRTITLISGVIALNSDMTITGPGANLLTVSGGNTTRIFSVPETPIVSISGMTLTQGNSLTGASPGFGGAIYNQGTLTISNLVITGNSATSDGGGVYVSTSDSLTVNNCTIASNTATRNGGGVYSDDGATLTVANSIIRNNTAQIPSTSAGGGGLYLDTTTFNMTDSTVSGNVSNLHGGGLAFDIGGTNTITRSTISGNSATSNGGGMYVENTPLTVTNSTISGNSAMNGGGIHRIAGTGTPTTMSYSTIANNTATTNGGGISALAAVSAGNIIIGNNTAGGSAPDCIGTLNSQGYNLLENTMGATITGDTTGNITGQDPVLGPLQNNGGSTFTHALLSGSPAIDKGNSFGLTTDQRGSPRPFDYPEIPNGPGGDGSDIGAFELQPIEPIRVVLSRDGGGQLQATITITNPLPDPVPGVTMTLVRASTLDGSAFVDGVPVPQAFDTVNPGQSVTTVVTFPGTASVPSGFSGLVRVDLGYTGGTYSETEQVVTP